MMPFIDDEPPLSVATVAEPGTRKKVAVMRARYEAGLAIFHPGDPIHEWAYNQPKHDTVSPSGVLVSVAELRAALRDRHREYQDD